MKRCTYIRSDFQTSISPVFIKRRLVTTHDTPYLENFKEHQTHFKKIKNVLKISHVFQNILDAFSKY